MCIRDRVMVFLLPAFLVNDVAMGDPFFCKYLCPQGVLEGAIPLSLADVYKRQIHKSTTELLR